MSAVASNDALHEHLALIAGRTGLAMIPMPQLAALLRECLASRAVVEAARRVVEGPIEGSQRALALLADEVMHMDGEMVG